MVRPVPALDDEGGLSKPARWQVELQVVTPMFGGSATTREVDSGRPIRATSIRGQLRFWWRAIYGRRYASPEELFKAEERIFGSDSVHGQVALSVDIKNTGTVVDYSTIKRPDPELVYAVFPFQPNTRTGEGWATGRIDVRFTVEIAPGSAQAAEVANAIRAWSTLGGVGARWRRGCGSLKVCSTTVPSSPQPSWDKPHLAEVTNLLPGAYVGPRAASAVDAWLDAVHLYRYFRQGEDFARNKGKGPVPGRSRYPEADSIRRIRGTHAPGHAPTHPVTGFPRADLGLPIIFHFKDRGEPGDNTLQGSDPGHARFASPIVTRALRRSDGYYPLVMILNSPPVWHYSVELAGPGRGPNPRPVPRAEIEIPTQRNLVRPLNGIPIRSALLALARSEGYVPISMAEVLT